MPREQLRKALQERRTKESTALSPRPKEPQPPPPDEEPLRGEQPIPTEPPPHQEPQLSVPRARPTLPTSPQEERGAGVDMAVRLAALAERVAELESHKALARRDDLEWLVGSALSLSLYPRGARQLFLLHAGVAPRRCRRCRLASEPRGEARAAVAGARKCPRRVCGCVCGTGGELATAALTPRTRASAGGPPPYVPLDPEVLASRQRDEGEGWWERDGLADGARMKAAEGYRTQG